MNIGNETLKGRNLLDESPPRSARSAELWTAPAAKRIRKLARHIGMWFIGTMAVAAAIMLWADTQTDVSGDVSVWKMALLLFLSIGILPAYSIHRILMRDVNALNELARDGTASLGTILKHQRLSSGLHVIDIGWQAEGSDHIARFDIEKLESETAQEVVLLSLPGKRVVAAAFGDEGLFAGRRMFPRATSRPSRDP
jgi:hypothetical protein